MLRQSSLVSLRNIPSVHKVKFTSTISGSSSECASVFALAILQLGNSEGNSLLCADSCKRSSLRAPDVTDYLDNPLQLNELSRHFIENSTFFIPNFKDRKYIADWEDKNNSDLTILNVANNQVFQYVSRPKLIYVITMMI